MPEKLEPFGDLPAHGRNTLQVMDDVARDLALVSVAVDAALGDPKTPITARIRIAAARADLREGMVRWASFARQMSVVLADARCGEGHRKEGKEVIE